MSTVQNGNNSAIPRTYWKTVPLESGFATCVWETKGEAEAFAREEDPEEGVRSAVVPIQMTPEAFADLEEYDGQ